jgi:hypothetical protein
VFTGPPGPEPPGFVEVEDEFIEGSAFPDTPPQIGQGGV